MNILTKIKLVTGKHLRRDEGNVGARPTSGRSWVSESGLDEGASFTIEATVSCKAMLRNK